MRPATALPFVFVQESQPEGDWPRYNINGRWSFHGIICGGGRICSSSHEHKQWRGNDHVLLTPEEAKLDAQYLVHAANAYPRLVEVLRTIGSTRGLEERYAHMLRDVNALLIELGEQNASH